jgi:hypothetical protein
MRLEELIQKNRQAFEEEVPAGSWMKIQTHLPRKKTFPYLRYAAILLAFLGIGFWMGRSTTPSALADLEKYDVTLVTYANKVQEKKGKLETLVSNQPDLEATFENDLKDLQHEFEELRLQLASNPNRELLIQAMKQNLEWQIELLNQQTKIAEKKVYML